MSNETKQNRKARHILPACAGVICIVLFFFLFNRSPLVDFLKPRLSDPELLEHAESFFARAVKDYTGYTRTDTSELDQQLLSYVQYYRKEHGRFPEIVPGFRKFVWRKAGLAKIGDVPPLFEVSYDFSGNFVGFSNNLPPGESINALAEGAGIAEDDAQFEAQYFLGELGVNMENLEVAKKEIREAGDKPRYTFAYENVSIRYPEITNRYTVKLSGGQIVFFQWKRVPNSEKYPALRTGSDFAVPMILMFIAWTVLLLTQLIRFLRKLRRDELDFKRALWAGFIIGIIGLMALLPHNYFGHGLSLLNLLPALFVSLFVFLGILLGFPTAESQVRAVWPEKLSVSDQLFQGRILFRETGEAILRSFFLAGLNLLVLGISFLAVTGFGLGYARIESDALEVFQSTGQTIGWFPSYMLLAIFIGISVLSFWPAFLREKLKKESLWYLFISLFFLLTGTPVILFFPDAAAYLFFCPIAVGWAYIVRKYDWTTVVFTFLGAQVFLSMAYAFLLPGSMFNLAGIIHISAAAVLFLLGIYLLFQPRSAVDFEDYVPDYVDRIAERERLLKELEIARRVQKRFLPQEIPQFPSLDIVSLCQPAMEVGGDYYDFVRLDDRHMSILIGDVSGKGVSAAFYMTMVKGIIKTLSRKYLKPAALLAEANEIFWENAPRDVFVTIIYGIFDLQERVLTVASAGHNPLIAWGVKSRTIQMVNPRGIALGLARGEKYREIIEEASMPIEEGDIFVFYTDGVSESMNLRNEIYGEKRLQEIIAGSADLPPRLIQKNIIESVSRFSGKAPQHDDFTMVVVKVKGEGLISR